MQQGGIDELQLRLDKLNYGIKKDDGDGNNNTGRGVGGGGGTSGLPGPPTTPGQEMDYTVRRLDYLRGNAPDVSSYNTREQNSRIILIFLNPPPPPPPHPPPPPTPQDQKEDYWRDVEQNWLGTPAPATISGPPQLCYYDSDFPPLSRQQIVSEAPEPRETSFSYPEGSVSFDL